MAVGRDVEEVAKDAGDENAGKSPGQGGGPEARGQEQEHVREVDVEVIGADGRNGGNGKGKAVGENGGANVVELESSDGEENASDGAQSLAGGIGSLGDAALLVDGGSALAQGDGGAVDGKGNVRGGSRKGDARGNLGKATSGRAQDGARVGPGFGRVSGLVSFATMLMKQQGSYLLGGNLFGGLGDSALNNLEALFSLLLYGLLLLLNGGGESPGAAGEVAGEVGVGREARGVLSNKVIESSFEVALLEVLVAAGGLVSIGAGRARKKRLRRMKL